MLHLPRLYSSDAQQQRIASAWLFVKYPPIIFLDVPTASLDAFKQGRAVVTISHSLAQIVDSACIYVIKRPQGQSGMHDKLHDMRGPYRDIFDASVRNSNIKSWPK